MKRCMLCKLRQNVNFLNTTDKILDFIITPPRTKHIYYNGTKYDVTLSCLNINNIIGTRAIKSDEAYYLSKLTCQSHMN